MKQFRSKRGITLVELVITMAIMTLVVGGAAVIFSMSLNYWSDANEDTRGHQNAVLAESWVHNSTVNATAVQQARYDGIKFIQDEFFIPIPADKDLLLCYVGNKFMIKKLDEFVSPGQTIVELDGIIKAELSVLRTEGSQYLLQYILTSSDGYTITNGLILNNMSTAELDVYNRNYTFQNYVLQPGSDNALLINFRGADYNGRD